MGTGLAALGNNGGAGNGILGNLFGGGNTNVLNDRINALQTDLAKEKSERYTDQKFCDLRSEMYGKFDTLGSVMNSKFDAVNATLASQAVWNATNTSTINCLTNQVTSINDQLTGLLTIGIASTKVISSTTSTT